jgi:hypothetical protein
MFRMLPKSGTSAAASVEGISCRPAPRKGGGRAPYGGTVSLGFKRGTWVRHPVHGVAYVGGCGNGRISLHSLRDGSRLCRNARLDDCTALTRCSWRAYT